MGGSNRYTTGGQYTTWKITLPRWGTLVAVTDPSWVAVHFSRDSAPAALPEPAAWPSAPSLRSVSWGGGRNTETLSSELSFNGVNDPFPSLSDPQRSGELCQIYTRITENQRLERHYKRSVIVLFSSSTSLSFGGSTACVSCSNEHFTYAGGNILDI